MAVTQSAQAELLVMLSENIHWRQATNSVGSFWSAVDLTIASAQNYGGEALVFPGEVVSLS
jgi:uncharacterized protein YpbB